MSFSLSIINVAADEARKQIKAAPDHQCPVSLKEFVLLGIHGLKEKYGTDVRVDVELRGHLCSDGTTHEITEAMVGIRKSTEVVEVVDIEKPSTDETASEPSAA